MTVDTPEVARAFARAYPFRQRRSAAVNANLPPPWRERPAVRLLTLNRPSRYGQRLVRRLA